MPLCLCVYVAVPYKRFLGNYDKIIKLGTVTASDMRMHLMLIILTLTFIQGHTELNHENSDLYYFRNCVHAMPIKFALKIVRLKVYMSL